MQGQTPTKACRQLGNILASANIETVSRKTRPTAIHYIFVTRIHRGIGRIQAYTSMNYSVLQRETNIHTENIKRVWSPYLKSDIELTENVQRRFTKRLKGLSALSYDDRLKLLNLERLEIRRLRFDLLCCYKIIFGLMRIDREAFCELRTSCTRGHQYKLFKHHSSISVRSKFFAERVINAWNGLPANRIDFSYIRNSKVRYNIVF